MNVAVSPEILVTGGTGTLGRLVVPRLRAAGRTVRVLSRHEHDSRDGAEHVRCDLLDPVGLDTAVAGVRTVLHLAGGPKGDDVATANLMAAAVRAEVQHVVLISVVGADAVPLGYFRAKAGAEHAVAESGLPWTTIRVAQVDTLVLQMVQAMARLPFVVDPRGLRAQPVHAEEVAARLVDLTLGGPAGLVADLRLTGAAIATRTWERFLVETSDRVTSDRWRDPDEHPVHPPGTHPRRGRR